MKRVIAAILGTALAVSVLAFMCPWPAQSMTAGKGKPRAVRTLGYEIPAPAGPLVQISNDFAYAGFPRAIALGQGGYAISYGQGASHFGSGGVPLWRESPNGVVWGGASTPMLSLLTPSGAGSGYAWGMPAFVAEPAPGGRVFAIIHRMHYVPGSCCSIDEIRAWLTIREPDGTWHEKRPVPIVGGKGFYPAGMILARDNSLWMSGYTDDGNGYYFRSTNEGVSWASLGTARPTDRGIGEPTLVQLQDGRVVSFQRADGGTNGEYNRLYWTIHSEDPVVGSWSTPVVAVYNGSGLPNATVTDDGNVFVLYRGFTDTAWPAGGMPPRALMFKPTAAGLQGYRGNIELVPGATGRELYGNLLKVEGKWRLFVGIEGAKGPSAPWATVYSEAIEFQDF